MKSDLEQTEIEAPYELPEGWKWIRQTSLKWERITKFIKRNVVDISNPCGNSKGEN